MDVYMHACMYCLGGNRMCLQTKTAMSRAYVHKHVVRMSARKQEREKVAELSHALAENADSWAVSHVAEMRARSPPLHYP